MLAEERRERKRRETGGRLGDLYVRPSSEAGWPVTQPYHDRVLHQLAGRLPSAGSGVCGSILEVLLSVWSKTGRQFKAISLWVQCVGHLDPGGLTLLCRGFAVLHDGRLSRMRGSPELEIAAANPRPFLDISRDFGAGCKGRAKRKRDMGV